MIETYALRGVFRASQLLACTLALCLVCSGASFAGAQAWAANLDDAQAAVDDAQAILDEAQSQLSEIAEQCEVLEAEVDRLQTEIDAAVEEVMDAQTAVLEGRALLEQTAVYEYRGGTTASLVALLFDSASFSDLLHNIEYINQVMQYQAEQVAEQKTRQQHFESLSADLGKQKDEQEVILSELEEKRAEAESVVASATAALASAQADYSSQLAALQAQAAALAQSEAANSESSDNSASSDSGATNAATSTDSSSSDSGDTGTSSDSGSTSSDSSTGSWLSGIASAYGGSTDSSTGAISYTATGAICDDSSMGVAVPMSLANYRSYFGRTVEIVYNGMTVYATVNDCGYMGGGSRVLDLQPGVWRAFGFSSCNAWGLRTVKYRFL